MVAWSRVMMKWPWCKTLLLLLSAPLPPAVTRMDERGPVIRHWARLQTYRFVLCAAIPQSGPLLSLIGCNSSKAILSARPAHVPYCSEGQSRRRNRGKQSKRGGSEDKNSNKKKSCKSCWSLLIFFIATSLPGTRVHVCFPKSRIWNIQTLHGLDSMFSLHSFFFSSQSRNMKGSEKLFKHSLFGSTGIDRTIFVVVGGGRIDCVCKLFELPQRLKLFLRSADE